MENVVSADRASSEGTTAQELIWVAEWHDSQAIQAERGNKSRRPNIDGATRHRRYAKALRKVASELRLGDQAAA